MNPFHFSLILSGFNQKGTLERLIFFLLPLKLSIFNYLITSIFGLRITWLHPFSDTVDKIVVDIQTRTTSTFDDTILLTESKTRCNHVVSKSKIDILYINVRAISTVLEKRHNLSQTGVPWNGNLQRNSATITTLQSSLCFSSAIMIGVSFRCKFPLIGLRFQVSLCR